MEPFCLALKNYWGGNKLAKVILHRDDGLVDDYFVSHCFRNSEDFSELEKKALESCLRKVLDLGAGVFSNNKNKKKLKFVLSINYWYRFFQAIMKR